MTALQQYRRLETLGVWRESPDQQRRDVVISLGDATLVISSMSETALTHWSLAALERLNPGRSPAVFSPGGDSEERLEIDDPDMVDALDRIVGAIRRAGPHPGRLRWGLGVALSLCIVALVVIWVPSALIRQTATMLPEAKETEIGNALLAEMSRLAGQPCTTPRGRLALADLSRRVFGDEAAPRLVVLPAAIPDTVALPGNIIVLSAALAEDYETPEVMAGYLLAEDVRRVSLDPVEHLLSAAGLLVTARLLTTGEIGEDPLAAHAVALLSRPEPTADTEALIERFAAAAISTHPYAYARDISGETVVALIEADPLRGVARDTLLSDESWVSLQEICSDT